MIFPSHASNTLRRGRYLRLKMARFRVERWAYARSWLRRDLTSLSCREENSICPSPPPYWERVQRTNIRKYFRALQRLLRLLSMFTNSLLYAAWNVFFWVFSGTTWRTKKVFQWVLSYLVYHLGSFANIGLRALSALGLTSHRLVHHACQVLDILECTFHIEEHQSCRHQSRNCSTTWQGKNKFNSSRV